MEKDTQQAQSPQQTLIMEGPKFETGGWGKAINNYLSRNKEKISLLILTLLIIAGGLYLYSSFKPASPLSELEKVGLGGVADTEKLAQNIEENQQKYSEKGEIKEVIKEKAERGEGVTHLARRALKKYLEENPELSKKITAEHKIYIEDYLKDNIGSRPLKLGEEISFSKDLIKKAIESSQNLTEAQLNNLKQYVQLISSLE